ncbi:MAG: PT domain-containing protein, partial [Anaerolineaceae bacterium]|nr:PT domain-containing protein [Anaerolineaceae bacterium]
EPTEEPTGEPTEEPTGEPTEEPTGEPTEEPTEEPTLEPTVPVEEGFFSTLREGGLGFGLIAKLVGIFGNQQECDPTLEGAECPMPIEQYVQEGGKLAPGQLFKEYGKPTILGVGHLRKAVQEKLQATAEAMEGEMDDTLEMEEDADQLKIKNKDQEGRTNNGNGVGVPGGGKIKNKTNGKKK